jgi:hypothetical protein
LALGKEHILVSDDEACIVLDAAEKRLVNGGERYVPGRCLESEKGFADFRQTFPVVENISEQGILIGTFRSPHRVTSLTVLYYEPQGGNKKESETEWHIFRHP